MRKWMVVLALLCMAANASAAGVIAPAAGEKWCKGRPQTIRWDAGAFGSAAAVRIELLNGNVVEKVIAPSAPNSGQYGWIPPRSLNDTTPYQWQYRVRVRPPADPVPPGLTKTGESFSLQTCSDMKEQNRPRGPLAVQQGQNLTLAGPPSTPDFQIIGLDRITGVGAIKILVINQGDKGYSGPLDFQIKRDGQVVDTVAAPVNLPAHSSQNLTLLYNIMPHELTLAGAITLEVTVNPPPRKVAEINTGNNANHRTFTKTCEVFVMRIDYEVTPQTTFGVFPITNVKYTARVDVVGKGKLRLLLGTVQKQQVLKEINVLTSGIYETSLENQTSPSDPAVKVGETFISTVVARVQYACPEPGYMVESTPVTVRYTRAP